MGVETVRLALTGIAANKLRSGLTILGMTIGVAAVIVLVAVGNGSSKAVQASIQALGSCSRASASAAPPYPPPPPRSS
jgi:putative ABC transport system permease protein